MKGGALLNAILYKEQVRVVKVRRCLGCSNHGLMEFRIWRGESKAGSKT